MSMCVIDVRSLSRNVVAVSDVAVCVFGVCGGVQGGRDGDATTCVSLDPPTVSNAALL